MFLDEALNQVLTCLNDIGRKMQKAESLPLSSIKRRSIALPTTCMNASSKQKNGIWWTLFRRQASQAIFPGSFCHAQGGTGQFKMNGGPGHTMLSNGVDEGSDESVSSLGFFCLLAGATRTCTFADYLGEVATTNTQIDRL